MEELEALIEYGVKPAVKSAVGVIVGRAIKGRAPKATAKPAWLNDAADTALFALADTISRTVGHRIVLLAPQLEDDISVQDVRHALSDVEVRAAILESLLVLVEGTASTDGLEYMHLAPAIAAAMSRSNSTVRSAAAAQAARSCAEVVVGTIEEKIADLGAKEPEILHEIRTSIRSSHANTIIEQLSSHSGARRVMLRSGSQGDFATWRHEYRKVAAEAHGYITPPDFKANDKFLFDQIYVPPRVDWSARGSDPDASRELKRFFSGLDRTVLLGDPGAGKSTAAEYLVWTSACDEAKTVPFLVVLRDLLSELEKERGVALVDWIGERCAGWYQCRPPAGAIEFLLSSGQALVVFDGLDELLDATRRMDVVQIVENFATKYPLTRVLVTSRKVGYEDAPLSARVFSLATLGGFQPEDVYAYATKWFGILDPTNPEQIDSTVDRFIEEAADLEELTRTPLMLALLCILFRSEGSLPRNRPAVYEKCSTLLFEQWDARRRIYPQLAIKSQVELALRHIAYWMYVERGGGRAVERSELVAEVADYLKEVLETEQERIAAAAEFVDYCKGRAWVLTEAGTSAGGEGLFKFTHQTFLEFFAASELTRRSDGPEALASALLPRIARGEWFEIAEMAVQIGNRVWRDGSHRVLAKMLADRRNMSSRARDRTSALLVRVLSTSVVPASTVRKVVARSLSTSLEVAGEVDRGDGRYGSRESIMEFGAIADEAREVAGEELLVRCLELVQDQDPRRFNYGLRVWLYVSASAPGQNRHYWIQWSRGVLKGPHRESFFGREDKYWSAWMLALAIEVITLEDYLKWFGDVSALPLDHRLFVGIPSPFDYELASWVESVIVAANSMSSDPDEHTLQFGRHAMNGIQTLGRLLEPKRDCPWLQALPAGAMPSRQFLASRNWTDDALKHAGAWPSTVLAVVLIELFEMDRHGSGSTGSSDPLLALLVQLRLSRAEGVTERDAFEMFSVIGLGGLTREEQVWLFAWAGRAFSVVEQRSSTGPAHGLS